MNSDMAYCIGFNSGHSRAADFGHSKYECNNHHHYFSLLHLGRLGKLTSLRKTKTATSMTTP